MVRHNNLCSVRNNNVWLGNSAIFEVSHFLNEVFNAESNTVADYIGDILMENTRRKLVKSKFSVIVDNCMSCVCTALKTNYDVAVVCENIGNFTLALVAPVGTYNCFYHFTKLLFTDAWSAINKIYT